MQRVEETSAAFSPSDAVLVAGALARLDLEAPPLFQQAFFKLLMRDGTIETLHANELSVVLNFFSRSGSIPSSLLARLLAASYQRLPLFGPPSLASTAFSLSRISAAPPPVSFLDALRDHAQPLLSAFNTQELSNILLAFARLTYHPGPLFLDAVAAQALLLLPRFTPQGLCNACNALAKLTHDPGPQFWERIDALLFPLATSSSSSTLSLFETASLLWSLAVVQSTHTHTHTHALFTHLLEHATLLLATHTAKKPVAVDVLVQLRQTLLHLEEAQTHTRKIAPPALVNKFKEAVGGVKEEEERGEGAPSRTPHISSLQAEVALVLTRLFGDNLR
jgi:hypothetical protein